MKLQHVTRHRAREIALQILYQCDFEGKEPELKDIVSHLKHFEVPEPLYEFVTQLVIGTLKKIPEIDKLLKKHTLHWKIERLAAVDRNLLRMAAYEILHVPETHRTIVINEAIELAKTFGTSEDTPAFINGVLDQI